jgi:triosephosphate isomerase
LAERVMRVKRVAGNWKMNGSLASNRALIESLLSAVASLQGMECVVCAPYPYLAQVRDLLRNSCIAWGAQDVCRFESGAYTGAVSAAMLMDFGCSCVIVGHSERRALFGDTDDVVAAKYQAAHGAGLTPILCVGETLAEREAGFTETVVERQLTAVLRLVGVGAFTRGVVAYEPVWAIGTGRTAAPEQAQAVHAFIRERVAGEDSKTAAQLPVLYGGSVKAANAAQLFAMPDIDGGLIGGASLDAAEFAAICRSAAHAAR